jgi:hypothetical protein
MTDISTILTIILTLYALAMGVFLISENRSPQATLAWMHQLRAQGCALGRSMVG